MNINSRTNDGTNTEPLHLVIAGPQGSGKGTQAAKLVERLDYKHVESGGVFRKLMKEHGDSPLAQEIKATTSRGQLVSDELTMNVIQPHLNFDEQPILLDGIPRSPGQARILQQMLGERNYLVIILNLSREECVRRIAQRVEEQRAAGLPVRADDTNPEAIQTRLDIYEKETAEALRKSFPPERIFEIDASAAIDEVSAEIFGQINEILYSPYTIEIDQLDRTELSTQKS